MARGIGTAVRDMLGIALDNRTGAGSAQPNASAPHAPDIYDEWKAGLDRAAEAERETQARQEAERRVRCFWPAKKPLPKVHVRRTPMPCPKCRRVLLDNGASATVCQSSTKKNAAFRCKACDHRWQMPVRNE